MQKTHFHNTGITPIYIGGVCIQPGSAREVDARLVPGAVAQSAKPVDESNPLLDLLDQSVPDILLELPKLTAAEVDDLEAAEKKGKTRKGVLNAIVENRLTRSKLLADLPSLTDEQLVAGLAQDDLPADIREAIEAEQTRRATGANG